MKITWDVFGKLPDGREAMIYTLDNGKGLKAEITNYGGIVVRLLVPDREGKQADVVLGQGSLDNYIQNPGYLGALVGRNSNRIADAKVEIAGKVYQLDKNDGENNLHGGRNGLSYQLMDAQCIDGDEPALRLAHTMADMSDGFPGNLKVEVTYTLTAENGLQIAYKAVSDKDTVINLTNHSYFNLGGHDSGPIYHQVMDLESDFYTPNTPACMPTGEIKKVDDSPFDFRGGKAFGPGIQGGCEQIKLFGGYDHNFVLRGWGMRKVATITDNTSGRRMEILTDLPGVQLFSGSNLPVVDNAKDGAVYQKHQGFCMETQYFPDAVNARWLACPIFKAGEAFQSTTTYRFTTI